MDGTGLEWGDRMRGVAKRWARYCAAALQRMQRMVCGAAAPKRVRRMACCTAALALVLLLCGDMVLQPRQPPLPELCAVERQLRALTADAPDGWRYSLRVLPGPGGGTLAADAARQDAGGPWETLHSLWVPENGVWRMVRQIRQKHCPADGAEGEWE